MVNPGKEALSGIVATSSMDYLNPAINRPDIFEESTTVKGSILRTPPKGGSAPSKNVQLITTLMTVILSGFIFVTIVGWFSLLQAYYDSILVNAVIAPLVRARLYYAITVTVITLVVFGIFLYIYFEYVGSK
jgi:hypothetical protein